MKNIFLAIAATAICAPVFAQSHADVDAAVNKFQNFYNHQQSDSIYAMLSDRSKALMPLDKTRQTFTQLTSQLGQVQSYQFKKEEHGASYYKMVFAKATLSLIVSLDKQNRLESFRFNPYSEDTSSLLKEKSNVVLQTKSGNIYGTLMMPQTGGKVPVVLLIAGSGPTDRSGNSEAGGLNTNTYKQIADSLYLAGIATLRYDKRGVGESVEATKSEDSTSFEDMVNDAASYIKLLKGDTRFSKIIVAGHSEGSLVGMLAARKEPVAGFISIAGIAQRADKIIEKQLRVQSAELATEAKIIFDSLNKGLMVKKVNPALLSLFRPSVQPYMISWLNYEPRQEIKKLTIPVLILQGTTDMQVEVNEADELKKARPGAKLKIIEGMNHPLKQSPADRAKNMATYKDPQLPLSPELIPAMVKFIENPYKA